MMNALQFFLSFFSLGHISSFACELKGFRMVSGSNCPCAPPSIWPLISEGRAPQIYYQILSAACSLLHFSAAAIFCWAGVCKHTQIHIHWQPHYMQCTCPIIHIHHITICLLLGTSATNKEWKCRHSASFDLCVCFIPLWLTLNSILEPEFAHNT